MRSPLRTHNDSVKIAENPDIITGIMNVEQIMLPKINDNKN